MPDPLRLLLLEDSAEDVELILRALRNDGFAPTYRLVDNEADFVAALDSPFEVILSDLNLPQFDGLQALEIVGQRGVSAPFIIVSGSIGEEVAVEAMRHGASDFLLKDRLGRLGPAIRHVLAQAEARRERARAEAALQVSEEQFREVVENISEVFWISDVAHGRMLYVSPAYATIWGRPCASLLVEPLAWQHAVYPEDRARVSEAMKKQAAGQYDETYRVVRPDGTLRWVRDRAFPVRDAAGAVVRIVGVAEDITSRKELEAQFLRAQRLEAVGTLAGGMAHDLNNILAPMLMAAGLLKESATSDHDRNLLGMIEKSAQRGADIIRQLLTFSRGIEGERRPIQLKHLAREMGHIVQETFPREITLVEEVPSELWPVVADPTQVHQIMVNLCVNARDAMPEGGRLEITARNALLDAARAGTKHGAKVGRYVVLAVADSGMGMPPEVIDHIFEPFFTTKGVGKGTGLGLSTVQGIVRSHGGFLDVTSAPGKGSKFEVYFPAAFEAAAEREAEPSQPLSRGEGQTILVVDDEEPVREAIKQVLQKANYQVVTATNGREGVVAFLRQRSSVKLVITDAMMPEMGGAALVRALQILDGKLKFIALSGLDSEHADFRALGVTAIVGKPCSPHALLAAVQQLFASA